MLTNEETERLLAPADSTEPSGAKTSVLRKSLRFASRYRFYICIVLIKLTHSFHVYLLELPLVRLVERAICQDYYKGLPLGPDWHHVDESLCKLPQIQIKVAYILGFRISFNAVPGLIMSVFYGSLADSYGRRPILALALAGEALALLWVLTVCYSETALRTELIWLEGLFYFIGGGTRLVYALIFTMIADYVPTPLRSRTMFLMHAVTHFVRIPALLISSSLMDKYLRMPFALTFGSMATTFVVLAVIPETLPRQSSTSQQKAAALAGPVPESSEEDPTVLPRSSSNPNHVSMSTMDKIATILRHRGLCIIIISFFLKHVAFASDSFLYQYASEKFHRKLSQTFGARLIEILGALFMTLIAFPLVTHIWHLSHTYLAKRDLWMCRVSMALLATSYFSIFEATGIRTIYAGMLLCGLGEGLEPALQALGSFIAGKSLNASFFTFITMIDTVAEFVGGPVVATLFAIHDESAVSTGYCFLFSAILFAALLLISWGINTSPIPHNDEARPIGFRLQLARRAAR